MEILSIIFFSHWDKRLAIQPCQYVYNLNVRNYIITNNVQLWFDSDFFACISQVSGFKSPSPLLQLPSFYTVNGIGIDSVHCVFLGVVKQLFGLWFNSKHSGQRWYCGNRVEKVDMRLLEINPPSVITRVPRSIEHHVKFWKVRSHYL